MAASKKLTRVRVLVSAILVVGIKVKDLPTNLKQLLKL
jgi:hypothetical protein